VTQIGIFPILALYVGSQPVPPVFPLPVPPVFPLPVPSFLICICSLTPCNFEARCAIL